MAQNGYAPIPRQTLGVTIAAEAGGNLSGSGTIYLWVQLRNRTGFNFLGDGAGNTAGNAIAYTAGQKITVTVTSSVVSGGEDPFELVVSAAAADTPANARRIASLWLRDSATVNTVVYSGQGAFISFPETLELTEDEHLEYTSQTVADAAALPTGNDLINGMVRLRSDDSTYYRYDSQQTAWTAYPTGFSAYVASLAQEAIAATQPQGCERQLSSIATGIQTDVILQPPNYNPDGSQQPSGLIYSVANGYESDSGAAVLQASEIAFRFFVNGVNNSTLFSGQVVATLKGYHNMADRTLDTSQTGVGSAVTLGSNEGTNGVAGLSLPSDLDRGYIALYEIQLQVDSTALASKIRNGDKLTAYPVVEGLLGIPFPPALALGELVLPTSDNMLVVPSSLAKVKMLGGVATVVDSSTDTGYLTRDRGTQNPVGLSNSTADQRICFNGPFGGDIVVRANLAAVQAWEVTRAVISTETGAYTASSYTTSTAIAGNGETLRLDVPIPTAVRSDYPDTQLAGNTQGDFTVPTIVPFVLLSGTIYQLADVAVSATAGNTQEINITDLSGATVVGSLPDSSSDASFGLWGYGANSTTAITSASSLAAGSYQAAIAWKYTGTTVSKISHSTSDGAIAVAGISYADLVEARGQSGFTQTTASFTQPNIGSSVTISVGFSGWISIGQTIFIQDSGAYTVDSIPSDTTVQATNDGSASNASSGATIATDRRVSPSGPTGPQGATGATGSTGPQGATGPTGADSGLSYTFDTGTSVGAASGEVRLNNATVASVTEAYINSTDADANDLESFWSNAVSAGSVLVVENTTTNAIALFTIGSISGTTEQTLGLTHLASDGTFNDADFLRLSFQLKGSTGSTGATGPTGDDGQALGTQHNFSTTTSSPPSTQELRLNNNTIASVSEIYIHDTDRNSADVSTVLNQITAGSLGVVVNSTDNSAAAYFTIDSITDNTSYVTYGVTYLAGSPTFTNGQAVTFQVALKGSTGATGPTGPTGATGADGADGEVTYGAISTNAQTGTTYTLVLADQGKVVECSNASAITLTVPPNSSVAFAVGTQIVVSQTGAGQVTVAEGSGVTVNGSNGFNLRTQWSEATLRKRTTDTWILSGDTEV